MHVPGGFEPSERRMPFAGAGPAAAWPRRSATRRSFPARSFPEGRGPGLILNVTNDAWFGDTPGPRQHFAQARLRAVEEGLPLVRAANTGISAVVDPYGRVLRGSLPARASTACSTRALPRSDPADDLRAAGAIWLFWRIARMLRGLRALMRRAAHGAGFAKASAGASL